MKQQITFDRFVRGGLVVAGVTFAIFLINRLSTVLLPFVVAWLVAYMMYPFVSFFENKCHIRNRALSIIITSLLLILLIAGFFQLIIPPMIEQTIRLNDIVVSYLHSGKELLPSNIEQYIRNFLASKEFQKLLFGIDYMSILHEAVSSVANIVSHTASILFSIISACIVILYTFFILLDYETFAQGWQKFIPVRQRESASRVFQDVVHRMNCYFRGQALIALIVGILFAIGFTIIDLPLAIGLGLFIGMLNLVPYLQTIGFIPATILALLKAADTGQNFWIIMLLVLLVFLVVQVIQDFVLTPRIMGKMMGLNPAVILLSLSIWGSLLGFIGLIIALPLTTIIVSYYRNFIVYNERQHLEETQQGTES